MAKVMICDDAAFMRMMIKDILTKNGYEIAAEAENGQKKPEKGGVRCEISVKFKTERLTSFRYSVIIPRENKAEHHRSHRLAVVETVNILCFVPVCENRCGNWWKRGRMMRTFLKSTHFIFV